MMKVPDLNQYAELLTQASKRKDRLQKFEQEVMDAQQQNPKVPLTEQELSQFGERFFKQIAKEAGLDVTE
ncbi:hypothetical protein NV379_23355 [Paenibacillus sp. N1-5-1-14]|uniref:hypothetical protein n=1 Tax=Paenibacillus radicibacter TaxID=2972488 RepID=UPI002158ADA5|nr:hypothetical protein [Paenibacillus radicibacter]MCR8645580.1 hypothetical protein [Paenibacillus radicibacter]